MKILIRHCADGETIHSVDIIGGILVRVVSGSTKMGLK